MLALSLIAELHATERAERHGEHTGSMGRCFFLLLNFEQKWIVVHADVWGTR